MLLFDLWHWELRPEEIEAIQAMFRAVDAKREARAQSGEG